MKTVLLFIILCLCFSLSGLNSWQSLQRELSLQAAAYQNSPAHQLLKQTNATRSYNVGDTKTFWRWNLSVMPPSWIQTPATCRAVGEHSYVFVADSEWNLHINQANIDTILVRLEDNTPNNPAQGAIEMDVSLFGAIPDELDNDPRLIVFYSALGSFQGTSFDGYFSPYNQVTEAEAHLMNPPGHSNECEMIYMTCYPLSPIAPVRLSVLAHELEHLIHWGFDADEDSWLDEGCAELAMVAYGVPDPISGFNSNPDNNLTAWNQSTADYVKVMLFFTYLQEHYDDTGLISDLIADPANGMSSLEAQIALHYPQLTVNEVLRNWTVANTLDKPEPGNGLYNYTQLALPVFYSTSMNSVPTGTNLSLSAYAADYFSYANPSQAVSFSVQSASPLYITGLLFDAQGNCLEVLTGNEVNQSTFSSLTQAAKAVFVVTNPHPLSAAYSYALSPVDNHDLNAGLSPVLSLGCHPNPWRWGNAPLQIELKDNSPQTAALQIFNLKGQLVRTLNALPSDKGSTRMLTWDGKDFAGHKQPSGIYLLRYGSGNSILTRKLTLLE